MNQQEQTSPEQEVREAPEQQPQAGQEAAQSASEQPPEATETQEEAPEPVPEQPQKSETELLQEKVDQLNDKLLRTMAEYDNFRKRSQREKEAIYPQATASAVEKFIPIIDTFERALGAPCADAEFKKGVEMIFHNFQEVLLKQGVEEFGAPGEEFDPSRHNAVMHIEDETLGASVITDVFQKGYKLGDRIIRHAMVKVAN